MTTRSGAHRKAQRRLAGRGGRTEFPIPGRRRLDVKVGNRAVEIERSGQPPRISAALSRLRSQRNALKELRVPQRDLDKAAQIARKARMNVQVKNLSGTRRRQVKRA